MSLYGRCDNTEKVMYSNTEFETNIFQHLIDRLNNIQGIELQFVSKIYIDKYCSRLKEKSNNQTFFRSISEQLDFNDPQTAIKTMNDWCAIVTNNRITNVFNLSDIGVTVILFSAVYFNGSWKQPFIPQLTQSSPFYLTQDIIHDVPTMYQLGYYNCGNLPHELNAHYIELPYKDEMMSMFIILPIEVDGLKKAEKYLDKVDFGQLGGKPLVKRDLYLPKFKIQRTHHIKMVLNQRVLESMFEDCVQFPNNIDALSILGIVQSIFIDVNEMGTDTATLEFHQGEDSQLPPPCFCVDRPFIYVIFDRATATVLFQGHVTEPNAE